LFCIVLCKRESERERERERERVHTHTHTHRGRQRHTEIIEIHTYIYAHSEEQVGMEMIGEKEGAGVDYLAEERAGAQFDLHSMKLFLAGGQHAYDVSKRMADLVANDPVGNLIAIIGALHLTNLLLFFLYSMYVSKFSPRCASLSLSLNYNVR
jgi:hypothetical protein